MLDKPATATKRVHLKLQEAVEISDILREVCTRLDGGYAQYALGWSDERVHEKVTSIYPHLTFTQVQTARAKLMGKIRVPAPKTVAKNAIQLRLVEIERRLAALEADVRALRLA